MQNAEAGRLTGDAQRASSVADTLKALAHPVRLRIVALLCEGDENVSGLAKRLGHKQAIVSQQLRILRMARLVGTSRDHGFARYTLTEPRLRELVRCFEGCPAPMGQATGQPAAQATLRGARRPGRGGQA